MKGLVVFFEIIFFMVFAYSCFDENLNPTITESRTVEDNVNALEDLQGLANGMYNRMTVAHYYGRDIIIFGEVRSDNCFANANSGRFLTVGQMKVGPEDNYSEDTWSAIYEVIASANIIIGQDPEEIKGNKAAVQHIIGQAYVIRALAHFDLLRLYGQQHAGGQLGIPYITVYKGEQSRERGTVEQNKESIYNDLEEGLSLLSSELNDVSMQTITTFAAKALQARVALYFGDWEKARDAALEIINTGEFRIVEADDFANSWATDSDVNSIFELAYDSSDNNNIEGLHYIYCGAKYGDVEVLDDLQTIFDENDVRNESIGLVGGKLRNLGKYPSEDYSDNVSLIRYEEIVLILAEAKFRLGEEGALDVLNEVPLKRNADLYTDISIDNILTERRKELCFEGFRFDDLVRTGNDIPLVDPLHQTHDGPGYGSYNYAFAIPTVEINANPSMVQNKGYY